MKRSKTYFSIILSIVLVAISLLGYSTTSQIAYAQEECTEERLLDLGVTVVNCSGDSPCISPSATTPATSPTLGSSVYVIGDSITYGMVKSGQLLRKINEAGYSADLSFTDTGEPTNQVSGPSVIARGGRNLNWGNEQVTANSTAIADSDVVLIGLGTNDLNSAVSNDGGGALPGAVENIAADVTEVVSNVRLQNPNALIYWTNVYVEGSLTTEFGTFNLDTARTIINQAIESVALQTENFTVIPWGTSQEAPVLISSDGIHPSGKYPEMADYIVGQLSNSSAATPQSDVGGLAGCSCSQDNPIVTNGTTEENYRSAWDYLVGTIGLSEEAAAGVMGNLEVESGGTMDPQVVQFSANFPGDRSPELPLAEIEGKFGYGIAQWTFPTRQRNLISYAEETNRSTGSLDLQLDFLFKELSESYRSALAVIETPGVTIEESSDVILIEFETPASVILPPRGSGTEQTRAEEIANRRERSIKIYTAYAGTTQAYPGASCVNTQTGDVSIDLDAVDTTSVACAPGTTVRDESIAAYNRGEQFTIKTCDYNGYTVNSQLSGALKGLVDKAAADGIALSANNTFRSMEEQIGVYNSWCSNAGVSPTPPPYPKASRDDYVSCPGGAPPGYSNHQMGFAIDFNCGGSLIPKSYAEAQSNSCFVWLQENAGNYGLFELGKGENRERSGYEGWHWSVDGT